MSYIGKTPTVGNFIKLDSLTASATASYTMQHGGVNFQPESALHMLVSLNGVIQSPNTSFTISGSTITFSSALTSSDSIDFIIVLGNVLDIGTPSDGTVTDAKANFVSTSSAAGLQIKGDGTTDGTLQLNCSQNSHGIKLKSPAHSSAQSYTLTFPTTSPSAGKVLQTDGSGNLSFGGNTPAFLVNLSGDQSLASGTFTKITFDSEVYDTDSAFASNKFTVPSGEAGKYVLTAGIYLDNIDDTEYLELFFYKNGSSANFGRQVVFAPNTNRHGAFTSTITLSLNASDYIEIYVYHDEGSNQSARSQYTFFAGHRLIGV